MTHGWRAAVPVGVSCSGVVSARVVAARVVAARVAAVALTAAAVVQADASVEEYLATSAGAAAVRGLGEGPVEGRGEAVARRLDRGE